MPDRAPLFNFTPSQRREYEKTTLRYTAAAHVQNYLDDAGLRAKDLAHRIHKSRAWVSKLLSGRQNTTLDTLADVAWALGAKWQMDMVAADRVGTPAENDPAPPQWAIRSSSTTTMVANPVWNWTHQRPSGYQLKVNIINIAEHATPFLLVMASGLYQDPNATRGLNAPSVQAPSNRVIASGTASLQVSEVSA